MRQEQGEHADRPSKYGLGYLLVVSLGRSNGPYPRRLQSTNSSYQYRIPGESAGKYLG